MKLKSRLHIAEGLLVALRRIGGNCNDRGTDKKMRKTEREREREREREIKQIKVLTTSEKQSTLSYYYL